MSKKVDLYIALMKFGEDKLEQGITFSSLRKHLREKDYSIIDKRLKKLFTDTYEPFDPAEAIGWRNIEDDFPLTLTLESKYRLIEYQELQDANKSSRRATYWAATAILVSVILMIFSIIDSHKQLNTPIKNEPTDFSINKDQLQQILELKSGQNKLDSTLSNIIENQKDQIKLLREKVKTPANKK